MNCERYPSVEENQSVNVLKHNLRSLSVNIFIDLYIKKKTNSKILQLIRHLHVKNTNQNEGGNIKARQVSTERLRT